MKKKYHFTKLSDKRCQVPGCDKRLKQRLVEQKEPQNIKRCYKHHQEHRVKTQHTRKNQIWL